MQDDTDAIGTKIKSFGLPGVNESYVDTCETCHKNEIEVMFQQSAGGPAVPPAGGFLQLLRSGSPPEGPGPCEATCSLIPQDKVEDACVAAFGKSCDAQF